MNLSRVVLAQRVLFLPGLLVLAAVCLSPREAGAQACVPTCSKQDECCGNCICDPGEDAITCPEDCPVCGDGICSGRENAFNCPQDCAQCGDGICSPKVGETCFTCPSDCGACPGGSSCGNTACEPTLGESCATCPQDCGACSGGSACGNGACESGGGESCATCPQDCGACTGGGPGCCTAGCPARPTFAMSDVFAAPGEPVIFTAFPDFIDDPTPSWDFGDTVHCEHCSTRVIHAYDRPGVYSVVLTATESVCHTAQDSFPQFITIGDVAVMRGNDARVVQSNLPQCLVPGSVYSVGITMRNTGTATWSAAAGYKLSAVHDQDPFTPEIRVPLPPDVVVRPLDIFTFTLSFTAPTQEGLYPTKWQMVQEDLQRFGDTASSVVNVSSSCSGGGPVPPGATYACVVSIHDAAGLPVPGKPVLLTAFTVPPGSPPTISDSRPGVTDQNGQATLVIQTPASPIQQLVCQAFDVKTTTPAVVTASDPVSVPSGTVLDLNLTLVADFSASLSCEGRKPGTAQARLFQSGPYDKPVVIPAPFDPRERTPERLTLDGLYNRFLPFLSRLFAHGYDVWLVMTDTGQNIHEQAAELAQCIDKAASQLGVPDGKAMVAGYSLGGVTARLATARYEADASWRAALDLTNQQLPVSLIAFGDAPLSGAQINLCLQQGIWELGHEGDSNLDSCAAQQLLQRSFPGFNGHDPSFNYDTFFATGSAIPGILFLGGLDSICDRHLSNVCFCDQGPAVFGVNGDGFAHTPELIAFSDGEPGPMMCYGDGRDLNSDGDSVCAGIKNTPRTLQVGETMYTVEIPLGSDLTCRAEDVDVQGGSRLSAVLDQRECFLFFCGGVHQVFNGTFIPFSSALPPGAPFHAVFQNSFQGVHGRGYAPSLDFVVSEMDAVASRSPAPAAVGTSFTTQPIDTSTGATPVTVTIPDVVQQGSTTLMTSTSGPAPFPGYVPGAPATYYNLSTNAIFGASSRNPITVCVNYSGIQFMDQTKIALFHFENVGWVDITSFRDPGTTTVCGNATAFSSFAIFEPMNRPPIASAGPDQIVEATSPRGAEVVLNGAGSIDPDGERLQYTWQDEEGNVLATTAVAKRQFALGQHTLTLTVADPRGATASATATVLVRDTTPPKLSVEVSPASLWPPNNKFVPIVATVSVVDLVDLHPAVRLVSIACDDGCNSNTDVSGAIYGTDNRQFALRATRTGAGSGRTYTITYSGTDFSGNTATASAKVTVPHDQGH